MDFILRDWKINDITSVAKYANNEKIAKNLRNAFPYPYTKKDAEEYITMCINGDDSLQYVKAIDVNGEAVGSIGVFLRDDVYIKTAELGYWLGEPFWHKGIMSCAIDQICHEVFDKYDIIRIFAEPYAHNLGSRRALEKAGFQLEGILRKSVFKQGEIFDSCMYAKIEE